MVAGAGSAPQPGPPEARPKSVEALEFLVRHGYAVLFVVVLGEQLGLPLLGAPLLLASGALAAAGRFSAVAAVTLAVAACLLADAMWYQLGRRRGSSVLGFICRISLEPDSCVRQTESVFARWGAKVLLVAKFLPGLNAVAPPLSGVVGMPRARFLALRHRRGAASGRDSTWAWASSRSRQIEGCRDAARRAGSRRRDPGRPGGPRLRGLEVRPAPSVHAAACASPGSSRRS